LLYRKKGNAWIAKEGVEANYTADPAFPYFISFPRTGSHHVKLFLELYFSRPLLNTTFFFPEKTDCLLRHGHDIVCTLKRDVTIYLYRNVVDTAFSYMNYHRSINVNRFNTEFGAATFKPYIVAVVEKYKKHLVHWKGITSHPINYDLFAKRDFGHSGLKAVIKLLGGTFDKEKAIVCLDRLTKERANILTKDVPAAKGRQIVQNSEAYEEARTRFRNEYGAFVQKVFASK